MKSMCYIYAALLLRAAGKEITGEKLADIISAAGGVPDPKITSRLEDQAHKFDQDYLFLNVKDEPKVEHFVDVKIKEEEITGIMRLFE